MNSPFAGDVTISLCLWKWLDKCEHVRFAPDTNAWDDLVLNGP
eukprot:COSAG02_NODE_14489_length_1266_cov_22.472151_1_plen_42_part_10